MTIWQTASAAIDAVFADQAPIFYTGAGLVAAPVIAIRSDDPAPSFDGVGATLRQTSYEVSQAAFGAAEPRKPDTFTHRGRIWHVQNVTRRDDIEKFVLIVSRGSVA